MLADLFTKKLKEPEGIRSVFLDNEHRRKQIEYNNVFMKNGELKIENLVDRDGNRRQ